MTHRSIIGMAACAVIAVVPSLAAAQPVTTAPDYETRYARVSYGDLDLATPAGQSKLYKRVGNAASRICRDNQPPVADLGFNSCRSNAVRDAGPQVAAAIEMAVKAQYSARSVALPEIIVR